MKLSTHFSFKFLCLHTDTHIEKKIMITYLKEKKRIFLLIFILYCFFSVKEVQKNKEMKKRDHFFFFDFIFNRQKKKILIVTVMKNKMEQGKKTS